MLIRLITVWNVELETSFPCNKVWGQLLVLPGTDLGVPEHAQMQEKGGVGGEREKMNTVSKAFECLSSRRRPTCRLHSSSVPQLPICFNKLLEIWALLRNESRFLCCARWLLTTNSPRLALKSSFLVVEMGNDLTLLKCGKASAALAVAGPRGQVHPREAGKHWPFRSDFLPLHFLHLLWSMGQEAVMWRRERRWCLRRRFIKRGHFCGEACQVALF